MEYSYRQKLIKKEVKNLLMKFHKGESLGLTMTAFMDMIADIRALDERKLFYVLKGLKLPTITSNTELLEKKEYASGFNEASEQNNFAIDLAINSFRELNDEEK